MTLIVITGANRGLGLEFARQFSSAGHEVVGTARNPVAAADLRNLNVEVQGLDVTREDSCQRFAESLGDRPVDILINNAGVMGARGDLGDLDLAALLETIDVNALGPIRVTRALLPALRSAPTKKICQITSKMGSIADNSSGGSYAYRMSKAALNMMNKSLSHELAGEGFVCTVFHPGWVQTDMGGASAPISAEQSVEGLIARINEMTSRHNGAFYDYLGEEIPW